MTDGVDLVDEHDARRLFLGLAEQIAHLGGAHADEHLHKFRTGNGKEGNVGFTGYGLGQHGLACARRADQQNALGHGSAGLGVLLGVVQVIDDLCQAFLGFILAGHVRKADALCGGNVDLGVALAKGHGVFAAHLVHHPPAHVLAQQNENDNGQYRGHHQAQQRGSGFLNHAAELRAGIVKALGERGVLHRAGFVHRRAFAVREEEI